MSGTAKPQVGSGEFLILKRFFAEYNWQNGALAFKTQLLSRFCEPVNMSGFKQVFVNERF